MVDGIKIQFLGGSNEVGSTALLLETNGSRFLFEYGMSPGKPPTYPMEPPPVDIVMLTHSHLDHSGMLPWLCSRDNTSILSNEITARVCNILFKDSVKIAKMDGYAVPFNNRDIKETEHSFINVNPKQKRDLGEHYEVKFHSAGHIPGSIMYELIGNKKILFTGDIHTIDTRIMKGAKPVNCDILFIEGTYAGREHPPRKELEKRFIDSIDEVVSDGGTVVIPAFAVSRSQELAMVLRKPGFNVWFDGMGQKVAKIFLKYPRAIRSAEELKNAMNKINPVHSDHGRKLALKADVIITSSGMMDGGPVLWYMKHLKNDPKSAVFLTGYQVEGTNSRLLAVSYTHLRAHET